MLRRELEDVVVIARLGVSIHTRGIRALLVQRGEIRWHASLACDFAANGVESLESILASLPKRFGVWRATIALGPAWCQLKQVEGLPAVTDLAMLTRLLRENSSLFFLRGGPRLAVSDVARMADGTHWAAGFDQDVALVAIEVLKKRNFAKTKIVPSVSAVTSLLPVGVHQWRDGEHVMELTIERAGELHRIRRANAGSPAVPLVFSGPLATLGGEAWENAAAFGAAMSPRKVMFGWRPPPDQKRVARRARLRLAAAVSLSVAGGIAAVAAPGARAAQTLRDASGEMNALRASQTELARTQGELRRIAVTLDRVERFRERRGKTTLLLGAISQALPESTALVTLRLDSLEGTFVALTPHAADILSQLAAVNDVSSPRIVGSLTKEAVGGVQLERATVRFKRSLPLTKSAVNAAPNVARRGGS